MIVCRYQDGKLNIVDRLREMVRLAGGLDENRDITTAAQVRALACLERFGQRLRHLPSAAVRVVGTNTLRSARNANEFLAAGEKALGHPIEIISGVEEARLIYLGVAHSLAEDGKRRLVMDIGGGSTEFIIGERFEPLHMESLYMGCVSLSRKYFDDGTITKKRMKRAVIGAGMELEVIQDRYRQVGWEDAIGASGTIRAVDAVIRAAGWSDQGITPDAMAKLQTALLEAGHVDKLNLTGLDPERAPVFPGGVAVLKAAFEALGIERMSVAGGALREGLVYDLVGRIRHEDVRSRTVTAQAKRYHADTAQAERVANTAHHCLAQVAEAWGLEAEVAADFLDWAARLHEIGIEISHSKYQKHGAYIVENADLYGFSRQEQQALALLIRAHRRKFPVALFKDLSGYWAQHLKPLAVLLRLATTLHRSRSPQALPDFKLSARKKSLRIEFPGQWLDEHPLTQADLEEEADYLTAAGYTLEFT